MFFTVPRKFGLPLVTVGMFCLGVPSALNQDFLINQVRCQANIFDLFLLFSANETSNVISADSMGCFVTPHGILFFGTCVLKV